MFGRLRNLRFLTLLICFVVLTIQTSGIHAHFDVALHDGAASSSNFGGEHHHFASSLFELDAADHQVSQSGFDHIDVEVDGAGSRSHFASNLSFDIPALLLIASFALLIPCEHVPAPQLELPERRTLRWYLRPLLRGPPSYSVA